MVMETLLQDIRYGARSFLRQPGFTLTAILALALGIGANTAVFSVVYAVLLKPLPYPQPDALVFIHDTYPAVRSASVSFQKLEALRSRTGTLTALGGMAPAGLTLTGGGDPEQVTGTSVTTGFMEALGVQPQYGRLFTADEDSPTGPGAIILSHQLWTRRFGADPKVLNTPIQVNGTPRTVVGIMPRARLSVHHGGVGSAGGDRCHRRARQLPAAARPHARRGHGGAGAGGARHDQRRIQQAEWPPARRPRVAALRVAGVAEPADAARPSRDCRLRPADRLRERRQPADGAERHPAA
jgi:hypothetical protein